MKNMRVLIDTNIILDWLMTRKPFQEKAKNIMETCFFGDMDGYVTAHTLSDIFYILRKDFDVDKRKKLLLLFCEHLQIIPEDKNTIRQVLECEKWRDLEDGLQMQCAVNEKLDYIVTRNIKDFKDSPVMPLLPEQLIERFKIQ